ncbi:MAG TPA: NUDIX domain-containing protein, partial [Ktedonobacterales bacterium]|nr:NUDIX domain-containing protein [Ktedonobacterales bacterium]
MLKVKVYAYVTREREGRTQALVFRHRVPDAPEAGIQVPGGTAEPGERPADALLRELREEAGIALDDPGRLVTFSRWITPPEVKIRYDTWFFLTPAPDG